jgi:DNA replication protein DnaC
MALSNADYNQIMRVYSQRQTDDEKEQQRRIREIKEKIPELARLDEAVQNASMETFSAMQKGDKEAIRKLKNQTRYAAEKRKALLREHGLPLDYLEMHYT